MSSYGLPSIVNTATSPSASTVSGISGESSIATEASSSRSSGNVTNREISEMQILIEKMELEDLAGGDGGESDIEGDELNYHTIRKHSEIEPDVEDAIEGEEFTTEMNGPKKSRMLKLTASGSTSIIGEVAEDGGSGNNPVHVQLPKREENWIPPPVKIDSGEIPFEHVDNPGGWDEYYFRPKFKNGKYCGHYLPTGAKPVPVGDDNGNRTHGGWTFYYDGFKNEEFPYRSGATTANLFPEERKGFLDVNVLKKLGQNKERIQSADALFFYQLLLPICDIKRSGIDDDPRTSYYSQVANFTNGYAGQIGLQSGYGHHFKSTNPPELIHFDGVLFHDGVLGGSNGAIYRRFDKSNVMYSREVSQALTLTRFHEIKRTIKLCNNDASPKRGEVDYNPAYKYALIYDAIVHNVNAITEKAEDDLVVDESTWGHSGYGESGTGLTGRLYGKKVPKGGQVVIIMDCSRFRPRAILHRNKIYKELYPEEKRGWSANGPFEFKYLCDRVHEMVDGTDGISKKIFRVKPCITGDNYFQNCKVAEYIGEKQMGAVFTSSRNCLPKEIKPEYLQKERTDAKNRPAKIARFSQPIIAVKDDNEKKFQRVHVSFQSTSSCNISTVNALNEVYNFVELRERGRKDDKRYWGIEMNQARRLYLSTYGNIDVLDHHIKNNNIFYLSWKYWHSPKNHALALAEAIAYDIYLEVCEGNLDPEWKVEKPVSSWEFRNRLSIQQLKYDPKEMKYPGDEQFRANTSLPRMQRKERPDRQGNITRTQLAPLIAGDSSRGCGDLDKLCHHVDSIVSLPKGRACTWCGEKAYHACGICRGNDGKPIAVHVTRRKSDKTLDPCFFNFHNDNCIGLSKDDSQKLKRRKKSAWSEPDNTEKTLNRDHIKELKSRMR